MHEGNVITDIVRGLLQQSGYAVYLNGWEERFSEIKDQLSDQTTRNSRTVRMIKSSPDLLVYDRKRKDVMFVEVKMRRARDERSIKMSEAKMERVKEFWNDAILVLVVPCGDVFYAQRFSELEPQEKYNAETDFERFEHIFTQVDTGNLSDCRTKAIQAMNK